MTMLNGALVQLVRMPACHAGGRWFESCTHRNKISLTSLWLMRDVSFIGESFSNAQCIMHNLLRPAGEIRASLKLIWSFALRNAFSVESTEYRVERGSS